MKINHAYQLFLGLFVFFIIGCVQGNNQTSPFRKTKLEGEGLSYFKTIRHMINSQFHRNMQTLATSPSFDSGYDRNRIKLNDKDSEVVAVSFFVLSNGKAVQIGVVQNFGNKILEREAVKAVEDSSPFPEPPKTLLNNGLAGPFRLSFNLLIR